MKLYFGIQTIILYQCAIIYAKIKAMIKTFKCKETEKIWDEVFSKKLPHNIQKRALMKLQMLNAASILDDLKIPPSNHLESLSKDRQGQYSIRINNQFRICFKWLDNHSFDVEIVDYH